MKKRIIELQLFADEAATAASASSAASAASSATAATEPGKTTTDKEPATAAKQEKQDEPKYTDAEFDRKLNQKFAEWQQKKDKEINEAKKLAEMNAQEKAEYALKQEQESHAATQKELDEYKRKDALAEMSKTARKMLADDGISVSDELLTMFVNTDAQSTKTAVGSFSKLFKEAVESAVKDRLRGETPKTGTGTAAPVSEIDKRIKKYM